MNEVTLQDLLNRVAFEARAVFLFIQHFVFLKNVGAVSGW